jgi:hypothetical protein
MPRAKITSQRQPAEDQVTTAGDIQVEAVMKMLSPEVNIRLIAPKRRRESAIRGEQPTGRNLSGATEAQGEAVIGGGFPQRWQMNETPTEAA